MMNHDTFFYINLIYIPRVLVSIEYRWARIELSNPRTYDEYWWATSETRMIKSQELVTSIDERDD